jgi:hypothetical protein
MEQEATGNEDYITNVTNCRMTAARNGGTTGLFAECRRLWREAGKLEEWTETCPP